MTQRCEDKDFPFTWECAGGKVEEGETRHAALRRELYEELDINDDDIVSIAEHPLWSGDFHNVSAKRRDIYIYMFRVNVSTSFDPIPCEEQGIGWFTQKELPHLNLAPGNRAALKKILSCFQI